jgi:long-chain acyl-CoA synthetase
MTNLSSLLENSTASYPDRTAIVLGDLRLSYAQVNGAANQVANLLVSRGVKPGDKVSLSCVNTPHFTIVYYGILKAGATVVPLNILNKAREIEYYLTDSESVAYFCFQGTPELAIGKEGWEGFNEVDSCKDFFLITVDPTAPSPIEGAETFAQAVAAQPATFDSVDTDDDDTAVILYTSGTTGQPKGAELRHRNMMANAKLAEPLFDANPEKPDTALCVLPLFHSFGQTVVQNGTLAFAGTVVLLPRFEPGAALSLMIKEGVTVFGGVPTMYWGLLNALSEDPSIDVDVLAKNLRMAYSGGSALPVEVHKRFKDAFGVTIMEGYGLSETSPIASFSEKGQPARPGSIGVPVPGVEMKLLKPDTWDDLDDDDPDAIGEIAIKGHNIMKGYYNRPEATEAAIQDGWFRSGDLGRKDEDGWYYIVDRSKDMIIRGGFNVYPREIEDVLMSHPEISYAAVIGVPHEQHGEEIKALIILQPGSTLTADDVREWGKQEMAAYKYPRIVEIVDSLPMTATGKILKRELK